MARWVTLAAFDNAAEAHVYKGVLEHEGIAAHIRNEFLVSAYWLYSNAVGGVELQVLEEDVAKALPILEAMQPLNREVFPLPEAPPHAADTIPLHEDTPPCPHCGSTDSEQRRSGLMAALSLYFHIPLPYARRYRRCRACGTTWR